MAHLSKSNPSTKDDNPRSRVLPAVAFHDQVASEWDRKYTTRGFRSRLIAFEKCLPGDMHGTWLDAGCGTGPLARWLVSKDLEIHSVDLSPRMLELFERHRATHPRKELLKDPRLADISSVPFAPGSFQGVLCSSALEYVEDPQAVLREFHRVLAPGGWLAISVPNRNSLVRRGIEAAFQLTRLVGKPWPAYIEYSVHRYTVPEFQELLHSSGFETRCFAGCGTSLPALKKTSLGWSLLVFGAIKKA